MHWTVFSFLGGCGGAYLGGVVLCPTVVSQGTHTGGDKF